MALIVCRWEIFMITIDKLKIYKSYDGDIDGWARRMNRNDERISSEDWYLIDSLIQDLLIVQKGLASKQFAENVDRKLLENLQDGSTIIYLKSLAGFI